MKNASLSQCSLGYKGSIIRIDLPYDRLEHLRSLGIWDGIAVEVVGRGLGGEPVAVQTETGRVAIGKSDARQMLVKR